MSNSNLSNTPAEKLRRESFSSCFAKQLATPSTSQITLSECECTRCVSDTDPELSLVCGRLNGSKDQKSGKTVRFS